MEISFLANFDCGRHHNLPHLISQFVALRDGVVGRKSLRFVGFKSVSQAIMNVDLLPKQKKVSTKGERTHSRPETPK